MTELKSKKLHKSELSKYETIHLEFHLSASVSLRLFEWKDQPILDSRYDNINDFHHQFIFDRMRCSPDDLSYVVDQISRWQMRVEYKCLSEIVFYLAFPTAEECLIAKLSLH